MSELDTTFAAAYREAERVKAEADARRLEELEEIARLEWSAHVYDPLPKGFHEPDPKLYEGTALGVLYGFRGSEQYASDLGDWRIIPGSDRP